MLVHLINFLRQSVTIEVKLVPIEVFTQTSCLIPSSNFHLIAVGFQDEKVWLTALVVFPFIVSFSIYGLSIHGRNVLSTTGYMFIATNFLAFLQSGYFNFYIKFRLICYSNFTEMPGVNRNEKTTCENWGTQTTKRNIVWFKSRCSVGSLTCLSCINFSTKSRAEMNYHIGKKHSKGAARVVHKGKICDKDCHSSYSRREHKRKEHGAQRFSWAQNVDVEHVMGDVDDKSLKED